MREWLFGKPKNPEVEEQLLAVSVQNGTAGRVVNDPDEQRRVREYRKQEAVLAEARRAEKKVLEKRREDAKTFEYMQFVQEISKRFDQKDPPKGLGSRERPEVVAVHEKMQSAPPYKGELGLFKSRRPKTPDAVLADTVKLRK